MVLSVNLIALHCSTLPEPSAVGVIAPVGNVIVFELKFKVLSNSDAVIAFDAIFPELTDTSALAGTVLAGILKSNSDGIMVLSRKLKGWLS